jgi:outer membrane protein assembly factor BamB
MAINALFRGKILMALVALLVVAGCAKRELILEGDRIDIRATQDTETDAQVADDQMADAGAPVVPLTLPPAQITQEWTHKNGSARHRVPHPALARDLTRIWSVGIGSGNSARHRLSSDPIIAQDRIYTLDSKGLVKAHSLSGSALWSVDLTPLSDKSGQASGGGLAFGAGTLVATTGFGEVIALDPATGQERWRQKMDAAISSAPVVTGNRVVAISRNNTAMGLDLENGRILWQQQSSRGGAGLFGGASPAAAGKLVVLPFASGEVVGALARNGLRAWSFAVTGGRKGLVRSFVGDISGDPVIDGNTIYVGSQSGRLVSINRRSGERNWTASEGAYGPVWPVGGSVFVVTDESRLKRLDASDGSEIWSVDLPVYKREKKRRDAYVHYGPILAGGRLIVASSDGGLRSFDPETGAALGQVDIPGGAASQPAIVGGVLYILSGNGQLVAFQ